MKGNGASSSSGRQGGGSIPPKKKTTKTQAESHHDDGGKKAKAAPSEPQARKSCGIDESKVIYNKATTTSSTSSLREMEEAVKRKARSEPSEREARPVTVPPTEPPTDDEIKRRIVGRAAMSNKEGGDDDVERGYSDTDMMTTKSSSSTKSPSGSGGNLSHAGLQQPEQDERRDEEGREVTISPGAHAVAGIHAGTTNTYRNTSLLNVHQGNDDDDLDLSGTTTRQHGSSRTRGAAGVVPPNDPNGQQQQQEQEAEPIVEASAVDDIMVVEATPVDHMLKQQQLAEEQKEVERQRHKAQRKKRRIIGGVLAALAIAIIVAVAVPLALRAQRAPPRTTTCIPSTGQCCRTLDDLNWAFSHGGNANETGAVVAICDGSTITLSDRIQTTQDELTVCCQGLSGSCTLTGTDLKSVLDISGTSVVLRGITFEVNYTVPRNEADPQDGSKGGNVIIQGGGDHTVERCTFRGGQNYLFSAGGGGGNLLVAATASSAGGPSMSVSVISSIFAEGYMNPGLGSNAGGGGLFVDGGDAVKLDGCTFRNNTAGYGGGFALHEVAVVSLVNNTMIGNEAGKNGGAGWFEYSSNIDVGSENGGEGNVAGNFCNEFFDVSKKQCLELNGTLDVEENQQIGAQGSRALLRGCA